MSNRVNKNLDITSRKQWNAALADVQRHLNIARRRAEKLEQIIQEWTRLRDEGMFWPGSNTQSNDHDHSEHHSI